MTDEQPTASEETDITAAPEPAIDTAEQADAPQYGVGPFTLREVILGGIWLVAFIISFFPLYTIQGSLVTVTIAASVWTVGLEWILTIGVPTVAVFLLVLRRLSPDGIRRVGSLGIDQFASVAFAVSATVWITTLWSDVARAIGGGLAVLGWVAWVELVLILAGVVLTVFAPFIPPFSEDFRGRPEIVAHRNARPVRTVVARPKPEPVFTDYADPYAPPTEANQGSAEAALAATGAYAASDTAGYSPVTGLPAEATAAADAPQYARSAGDTGSYPRRSAVVASEQEPVAEATPEPTPAASSHQAFWALAPVERDVYDERGVPIFRIAPTAWALVIEDRGSVFVIRHEDGRIGYLHDVQGITRG